MNFKHVDYIVFDCDGVILQSNSIKSDAFRYALSGEPADLVDKLVEYHKAHGGVTRREKITYFYQRLKGSGTKEDVDIACERFGQYCQHNLATVPFICGVREFIERLTVPVFVVTGGDQLEVRKLFEARNFAKHFQEILGGPASKRENMLSLQKAGCFEGRGLYFGDSLLDFELAEEFEQAFCFVSTDSEWVHGIKYCSRVGAETIKDFSDLLSEVGK